MAATWPVEEFREYLRVLMDQAGIPDYAELHRRTGVSQTQFSHWRKGNAQPSADSLRRIAPALGVAPAALFLAAGLNLADEIEPRESDLAVLPREIRDLLDLWANDDLTGQQRDDLRRSIGIVVAGVRAGLDTSSGRRKRSA